MITVSKIEYYYINTKNNSKMLYIFKPGKRRPVAGTHLVS